MKQDLTNQNPIRIDNKAREALEELFKAAPNGVTKKELASQAIIEKRDREMPH